MATSTSTIDPVSRIEGHLRVEMEVEDGVIKNAWTSAGLFRGMELILENRAPHDAVSIVQRICGVCPVSHSNVSAIAAEKAFGIKPPTGGRIVRNLVEFGQFMYSHITWFYVLNGLDYCSPIHAVQADPKAALDAAVDAGTPQFDATGLQQRLANFADNGQLSIFSGNWFDTEDAKGGSAYHLSAEQDLIVTAHYLQALEMQAKAAEINGILGGKMPHVTTFTPGGSAFVPNAEKIDDVKFRADEIAAWVHNTLWPDAKILASAYTDGFEYGKGVGMFGAWGVFETESFEMNDRYMPAGILVPNADGTDWTLEDVDPSKITESTKHAYYKDHDPVNPLEGITEPWYPAEGATHDGKYSWCKAPRYDGKPLEVGSLARVLVAYKRGVPRIVELVDELLEALGQAGNLAILNSVTGRIAARACETVYLSEKFQEEVQKLIDYMAEGGDEWYTKPTNTTGTGEGFWEAPRGALYHCEKVTNDNIDKYQIIIPSTWNLGPRDEDDVPGPLEQALVGTEVVDIEKPIKALRIIHSFDPCTACSVHVFEPKTGKEFTTVESPWGVR
ncbi:nickel-dependent hydrogenase large subunit [bacterium]|nr:nickel-dependent hydrogenase large subunit [bacterium]